MRCTRLPRLHPECFASRPVKVFLIDFAESAVQYEIKFWLMDGRVFPDIIDGVRTNVWYELNRRGIRLAFSTQQIELVRGVRLTRTRETDLKLARQPAAFLLAGPDSAGSSCAGIQTDPFWKG